MSDEERPEVIKDAKPTQPAPPQQATEELSEQELDNVNGAGATPHMQPPGPPIIIQSPIQGR